MTKKTPLYVIKYFSEHYNNKPTPKNVLKWLKKNKQNNKGRYTMTFIILDTIVRMIIIGYVSYIVLK
jgi:hypothetical protein